MPQRPADNEIEALLGKEVVDRVQQPVGRVGQVYLDERTGRPSWVTVRTGWFGLRETFVPLAEAQTTGGQIRVPYDKALIKDAPHDDTEERLPFAEQDRLYRHYAIDGSERVPAAAGPGRGQQDRPRLRKYVVTETRTATVQVTQLVPVIKRIPITDTNRDQLPDAGHIGEQEVTVVLHEDRPVVQVESVPLT